MTEGTEPTDALPEPATELATEPLQRTKASGRKGLVIALVLVGVVALGLAALSAYLWTVHSDYVAQNETLRTEASDLGKSVADARAQAEGLQTQLDDTKTQLDEAKATINSLANSEAQAGDDRQALIDVADSLLECANARQDLIGYLHESWKWTPASLKSSESSITTYCKDVSRAYKELLDD